MEEYPTNRIELARRLLILAKVYEFAEWYRARALCNFHMAEDGEPVVEANRILSEAIWYRHSV
eukprot:1538340-Prorocentrum_lima.AAC.1